MNNLLRLFALADSVGVPANPRKAGAGGLSAISFLNFCHPERRRGTKI